MTKELIKHLVEFVQRQNVQCHVTAIPIDINAPISQARLCDVRLCFWYGDWELEVVVDHRQIGAAVYPKAYIESLAVNSIRQLCGETFQPAP